MTDQDGVAEMVDALRAAAHDPSAQEEFTASPHEYLSARAVPNVPVQVGAAQIGVYELLGSADPAARVAVARTIAARVRPAPAKAGEVHPNVVIPLANAAILANAFVYANANVIANANVSANANAGVNANVRVNVNAKGLADYPGAVASAPRRRLRLSEEYLAGTVHDTLSAHGYSEVRQAALIKSLLGHELVVEKQPGVQRFALQSGAICFEVDVAVDVDASVVVLDARILPSDKASEASR
jgi:hypothetical protein